VSGGGAAVAALAGLGVEDVVITVDPTEHDFGSVAGGTVSVPVDVVVTNPSASATVGTPLGELSGSHTSQFQITATTCAAPLGPGEACTFTVTHQPTFVGTHSAALVVTASDGGTATTLLSGTGLSTEGLSFVGTVNPDGGDVVIGAQSSVISTFTVNNLSNVESGDISTTLIGAGAASFVIVSEDCTTLVGGETCSVDVRFVPQAPAGLKSAQLQVSATPGGTIVGPDITGNAVAP
jgi:hypothetical protein